MYSSKIVPLEKKDDITYGSSKITKLEKNNEITHLYQDIVMLNKYGGMKQAEFLETRTQAILKDPSEYYCSVVKFAVPTHNVPIFVATPLPNPSDVNILTYSVTLRYNSILYTVNLIMTHNWIQVPVPTDPTKLDNRVKFWQFYSVIEYGSLVVMLNRALASAFTLVKTANPGITSTAPPYITFDVTTGLMAIVVQDSYKSTVDALDVFFSSDLYEKVRLRTESIRVNNNIQYAHIYTGNSHVLYGIGTQSNQFTIPVGSPGAGTLGTINYQSYSSLWSWNDLVSVVLTTTLPIVPEVISGPISELGEATTRQIFSDFTPVSESGREIRNEITYFPSAEYRLVDFASNAELRSVGFQWWWMDAEQNLFPIMLDSYDACSMKVMYRKKNFKE